VNEGVILALTAIVGSIGVAIKQIIDIKEVRKWICYKNPCNDRDDDPPKP